MLTVSRSPMARKAALFPRVGAAAVALALATLSAPAYAQAPKGPKSGAPPAAPTRADSPPPLKPPKMRAEVPVLGIASDDAEDQAEALTGALRSRIRVAPGVVLDETAVNLSTLMSALGCGSTPDPLCLLKVGDQLKVDRFVWGHLRKGPDRGHVTAEVHLWRRRGTPDTTVSETFSENLRDQNDDVLRRIAGRISDRLFGQPVAAPVTVRVGDVSGEIVVDGGEPHSLVRGEVTVELRPGRHTLVVTADGYDPLTRDIEVSSTAEQVLTLKLAPKGTTKVEAPSKPISTRTVVALGFIGVGVGFGIAGTVKATEFLSIRDENRRDYESLRGDFCSPPPGASDLAAYGAACQRLKRGEDARLLELVFYGVAAAATGTGLVLLVTDTPEGEKAARRKPFPVVPTVGRGSGHLDLKLSF